MKTVFKIDEVAHIWANQTQNEGRTSANNFYFRDRAIYSYGSHFCIAEFDILYHIRHVKVKVCK